jgi:hypothetical protein
MNGQLQATAALLPGKELVGGGSQSRSGHGVEEKNSQLPPRIETRSSERPFRSQSLYQLIYPGSCTLQFCFPEVYFNIAFPSTARSSEWSIPFRFPYLNFVFISHLSFAVSFIQYSKRSHTVAVTSGYITLYWKQFITFSGGQ